MINEANDVDTSFRKVTKDYYLILIQTETFHYHSNKNVHGIRKD